MFRRVGRSPTAPEPCVGRTKPTRLNMDVARLISLPVRIIIGSVCVISIPVCGMLSLVVHQKMLDAVNSRLPKEQQFAYAWWGPSKKQRFYSEYHRLYPSGLLVRKLCALGTGMVAAGVVLMIVVGFGLGQVLLLAVGGVIIMWLPYLSTYWQ